MFYQLAELISDREPAHHPVKLVTDTSDMWKDLYEFPSAHFKRYRLLFGLGTRLETVMWEHFRREMREASINARHAQVVRLVRSWSTAKAKPFEIDKWRRNASHYLIAHTAKIAWRRARNMIIGRGAFMLQPHVSRINSPSEDDYAEDHLTHPIFFDTQKNY